MSNPDWTHDYFERGYAQRWSLAPPSGDVHQQAVALAARLQLASGSRLIDIGCGHGRYSLALAELGADVIGVDTSIGLLKRARDLADNSHTRIRLVRGDMRRLPLQSASSAAAVIMDAFGFFDTEEEHEAALREVGRVLTADGCLVMKVVNGGSVIDNFRPTDRQDRDGVVVTIDRSLALAPARMTERIRVTGSRGHGEYQRRQRLYRVDELCSVIEGSGFDRVEVFAAPDGTPFDADASTTMWLLCRRA